MKAQGRSWQACEEDRLAGIVIMIGSILIMVMILGVYFGFMGLFGALGARQSDLREMRQAFSPVLYFQAGVVALNVIVGMGISVSARWAFVLGLVMNLALVGGSIALLMDLDEYGTLLAIASALYCGMRLTGNLGTPKD